MPGHPNYFSRVYVGPAVLRVVGGLEWGGDEV